MGSLQPIGEKEVILRQLAVGAFSDLRALRNKILTNKSR